MLLTLVLAAVGGAVLAAMIARARLEPEPEPEREPEPRGPGLQIVGHRAYTQWWSVALPGPNEPARCRLVVLGVFPTWLQIFVDHSPDGVGRQGGWLLRAALGEELPVPPGWSVLVDRGDLCIKSAPVPGRGPRDGQPDPDLLPMGSRLVQAYLRRGGASALQAALVTEARVARRPEALHLLLAHFAGAPEAEAARQAALHDPEAILRLTAASADGREDLPTLRALALPPTAPIGVRRGACAILDRLEDLEGLLAVAHAAPSGVETVLASGLARHEDPRVEAAALPLLATPDELVVERVADLLGRQGTLAAVPALTSRLAWAPQSLAPALQQAVQAIQRRAGPESPALASAASGAREAGGLTLTVPAGAPGEAPEES